MAKTSASKKSTSGSRPKKTNSKTSNVQQSIAGPRTLSVPANMLTMAQQQRILDLFSQTFQDVLTSPSFTETVQEVKQALFDRDFIRAFAKPDYLAVYAARWSPTRALGYAAMLAGFRHHLEGNGDGMRTFCVGGGAAELVAIGAFLHVSTSRSHGEEAGPDSPLSGEIVLLDSGPWGDVVARLADALTSPPPPSKYASEAVRAANHALVAPSRLSVTFQQRDVLDLDESALSELLGTAAPVFVTLLFTLNELFTSNGVAKTTRFLLQLTSVVPIASFLLVVDSPGSYSETPVGQHAKKYPMHWLLDKILLERQNEPGRGRIWTKVMSEDSVWFRLLDGLRYSIPLENMRYQVHLYRADSGKDQTED